MTAGSPLVWDTSTEPSAFEPEDWLAYRERVTGRVRPSLPARAIQTVDETVWRAACTRAQDPADDFTGAGHPFVVLDEGVAIGFSAKGSIATGGLDELFALGVLACVSIGGAGAITGDVHVGEIVVPREALADDGVACQYVGPSRYVSADARLTAALRDAAGSSLPAVHEGRVWSTTAHFRQTRSRIEAFRREGCVVVDNESAGAFAAGQHRKAAVARLLVVGDTIAEGNFVMPFPAPRPIPEVVLDVALAALDQWAGEIA